MSGTNEETSEQWILVRWAGSFSEDAYDIINANDVVFDDYQTVENLKSGSTIVVRCGNMKSPANVILISDDTDYLVEERLKMKENALKEISQNIPPPKSNKKRRLKDKHPNSPPTKTRSIGTQTENLAGNTILNLIKQKEKLEAQLETYRKICNSMCSSLKTVLNDVETQTQNNDFGSKETPAIVENNENVLCSCQVVELKNKVLIGVGKTEISSEIYNHVNWLSYTAATRKLLTAIFPRNVLASHSLTGKPSPAFLGCDMPLKEKLDPVKVADIVAIVTAKCGVTESMVRSAITTKCADENKMFKKRLEKQ